MWPWCAQKIAEMLDADPAITHVAMVHSETTSGILNDIEAVGRVVKERGRVFIVDAMSSFGGVDIPVKDWGIDFIISSANKCIQGVPGFSFIIARRDLLEESAGKARSLSLDLYDQWKTMEVDGKWRFTSPTHVVLAFAQAMKELEEEGGIEARSRRYTENNRLLIEKMGETGTRRITVCSLKRWVKWGSARILTARTRGRSSPPSSTRKNAILHFLRCMNTSRTGAMPSIRAR